MNHPRASGPATAAQYLVIAEPGRGIFFVRAGFETRVGVEVGRRPFPRVADHLPTAEGTIAAGKSAHIDATTEPPVEIRKSVVRLFVSPGKIAVSFAANRAVNTRFRARRHLPFCLIGQPALGPATVAFGFKPVDVQHGQKILERHAAVESALPPLASVTLPIDRMFGIDALSPVPSPIRPKLPALIAVLGHKGSKLSIGDRSA